MAQTPEAHDGPDTLLRVAGWHPGPDELKQFWQTAYARWCEPREDACADGVTSG